MVLEAGRIVEKYVVERLIGRGPTGRVYRIRHRDLGVAHALKVVGDPELGERLRVQGRLQAELRHPGVVGVYDLLDIDGQPALVTELVDGPSLARLLEQGAPSLAMVDEIARGVLEGVRAAHLHGLVHGGLKPANVLLAHAPYPRSDDGIVPKISDFGLAEPLRAGGPPRRGLEAGVRADVFALGVLLYELCSGRRPCDPDAFDGTWPPVEEVAPGLPDRMPGTIGRALTLHPAERFPSVDEMLDCWIGGGAEATVWHPVLRPAVEAPAEPGEPDPEPGVPGPDEPEPDPSLGATEIALPRMVPPPRDEPPTEPALPRPVAGARPTRDPPPADWRVPAAAAALGLVVGAGMVAAAGAALFAGGLLLWSRPGEIVALAPAPLPLPSTPAVSPAVAVHDEPAAESDPPSPRPSPPARGPQDAATTVALVGDAEGIVLRDAQGREHGPGPVPAGRYRLAVTFPGADEIVLDTVVAVDPGQAVTIDCRRAFFACSVR